jgi:hypothetical protein
MAHIKIPSSGDTTPEYIAVRKSCGDINPVIIPDVFVNQAYSCGLTPTRNLSNPPLDVVLKEISLDPVNYYSLQHVVATLNVGGRFDKGTGKMEAAFQCKDISDDVTQGVDAVSLHAHYNFTVEMRKYIPAVSSEDRNFEPGIFIVLY